MTRHTLCVPAIAWRSQVYGRTPTTTEETPWLHG